MTNFNLDFSIQELQPLASRIRPRTLDEYCGQEHLLGDGKVLRRALDSGHIHSMILWGNAGIGKTTLAEIFAHQINAQVEKISAVTAGIKEIRNAIENAQANHQLGQQTILFVDEVHRFNKSQQDAFLPYIEDGTIIFIGATTENPSFALNNALLSRARVYLLQPLEINDIVRLLTRALNDSERGLGNEKIIITDNSLEKIANYSQGDARLALNCLELLADCAIPTETEDGKISQNSEGAKIINNELLTKILGTKVTKFDKDGDYFYDTLSALHKSIRGSSPDGALYWYARILTAGGDPLVVARRLLAIASEDIGNADPRAMQLAINAWDCFTRVGTAEGERAIAQAVVYMALAPKSNAVYTAFKQAKELAQATAELPVPLHLRNAPTKLMQEMGCGAEYRYAHNEENAYSAGENYFPPELKDTKLYFPVNRGLEIQLKEKMDRLAELDQKSTIKRYPS